MMEVDAAVIAKAKRRIKRFVKTGESQARVRKTPNDTVFFYVLDHTNNEGIYFRKDKVNRLYKIT